MSSSTASLTLHRQHNTLNISIIIHFLESSLHKKQNKKTRKEKIAVSEYKPNIICMARSSIDHRSWCELCNQIVANSFEIFCCDFFFVLFCYCRCQVEFLEPSVSVFKFFVFRKTFLGLTCQVFFYHFMERLAELYEVKNEKRHRAAATQRKKTSEKIILRTWIIRRVVAKKNVLKNVLRPQINEFHSRGELYLSRDDKS